MQLLNISAVNKIVEEGVRSGENVHRKGSRRRRRTRSEGKKMAAI